MASLDNVEIYPLISLAIFLTVFIGFTWYAIRAKKDNMNKMSQLPLDD
jgi:cbb3-type cytochrome oxidase subunit 3